MNNEVKYKLQLPHPETRLVTIEEEQQIESLFKELHLLRDTLINKYNFSNLFKVLKNWEVEINQIPDESEYKPIIIHIKENDDKLRSLIREQDIRYYKSFQNNFQGIIDDVKEVLNYFVLTDFEDYKQALKECNDLEYLNEKGWLSDNYKPIRDDAKSLLYFLKRFIWPQIKAIKFLQIEDDSYICENIKEELLRVSLIYGYEREEILKALTLKTGGNGLLHIYRDEPDEEDLITSISTDHKLIGLAPILKPNTYSVLNSKIVNRYSAIEDKLLELYPNGQISFIDEGIAVPVPVNSKNNTPVTTLVSLTYEGDLPPSLARLKAFDKAVLNAIVSIIQVGNNQFTVEDILRTLNGNNTKQQISVKQKERVINSLKKLSSTRIWIDFTEELNNHYFKGDDIDERLTKGVVDEALFNYRGIYLLNNKGKEVYVIQPLSVPILMAYSKAKNQLVSYPSYLLNTTSVNSTDEIIVIREYLAKQIKLMKDKQRDNPVIKIDTIFEECNITATDRTKKKRLIDSIQAILTEWTTKEMDHYIKGYTLKKEGKSHSITGIKISY